MVLLCKLVWLTWSEYSKNEFAAYASKMRQRASKSWDEWFHYSSWHPDSSPLSPFLRPFLIFYHPWACFRSMCWTGFPKSWYNKLHGLMWASSHARVWTETDSRIPLWLPDRRWESIMLQFCKKQSQTEFSVHQIFTLLLSPFYKTILFFSHI